MALVGRVHSHGTSAITVVRGCKIAFKFIWCLVRGGQPDLDRDLDTATESLNTSGLFLPPHAWMDHKY
jgi:hypothetical protein